MVVKFNLLKTWHWATLPSRRAICTRPRYIEHEECENSEGESKLECHIAMIILILLLSSYLHGEYSVNLSDESNPDRFITESLEDFLLVDNIDEFCILHIVIIRAATDLLLLCLSRLSEQPPFHFQGAPHAAAARLRLIVLRADDVDHFSGDVYHDSFSPPYFSSCSTAD